MTAPHAGNKVLAGVIWNVSGTAGQAIFQLIVFIVLARTLTPDAFGLVAIASALIDILNLVGRLGLVEVLVHRPEVQDRAFNTSFFASAAAGVALAAGLFVIAPLLATIFATPDLTITIRLLAPVCVLYAIGAVYEAKLRRAYQFKQLALRNATATVVSGIVALWMALAGFGVYALIAQRLISTAWALVAMGIASKWLPRLDVDLSDMRTQIRQGTAIAFSSVLGAGNQKLIDLIVGYFLGPTQLGYMRVAWRMLDLLIEVVVRPITSVTLTTLSATKTNGKDLSQEYISIIRWSSIIIVPFFIGISITAPEFIHIIFGSTWDQSSDILAILAYSGIFVPLIYFKTNILIAAGQFRKVLNINAVEFLLSVLVVSAFAPFGLIWAAIGNVVRTGLAVPIILMYIQREVGTSSLGTLRAALPAIAATMVMVLAVAVAELTFLDIANPIASLVAKVAVGALVYLATLLIFDRRLLSDLKAHRRPI